MTRIVTRRGPKGNAPATLFCARFLLLSPALLLLAPTPVRAQTRDFGIDVSQFQGTVDWARVARPVAQGGGGVKFAFIRATRGGTVNGRVVDTRFATNIVAAKNAGLRVGIYHFARWDLSTPGVLTGLNSPADEAQHFLSIAGPHITDGSLRPVLDLEADSSDPTAGTRFTRAQLTDWALGFCSEIVKAKGPSALPLVYINGSFANDEIDARLNVYPLWFARYGANGDPLTTGQPLATTTYPNIYGAWNPTGSLTNHPWAFWQYSNTGSVPGITGNVDLNVFNNERYFNLNAFTIASVIPEPASLTLLILPAALLARRR